MLTNKSADNELKGSPQCLTLSCAFGKGGRATPVPVGLFLLEVGLDEDVEGLVPFMLVRGLGADFADGFSGIFTAHYENYLRLLTTSTSAGQQEQEQQEQQQPHQEMKKRKQNIM
ncbi:GM10852 [Drosophila sechellia]|uniref:GM10852 n=1 Tax=Drosophila sechellia TaxID=7238 RepID=B4I496_DROSE|nr:GM10852 [Drosophila sechellia]